MTPIFLHKRGQTTFTVLTHKRGAKGKKKAEHGQTMTAKPEEWVTESTAKCGTGKPFNQHFFLALMTLLGVPVATGCVYPCDVPVGQGTTAPTPAPGAWTGNRWEVVPEPFGGPEPAVMDLPPQVAVTHKPPHRGCWRGAGLGTVELLEGVFHGASSFLGSIRGCL